MKKFISLAILCLIASGLSSCNTIRGIGQDVESLGESLQDVVD